MNVYLLLIDDSRYFFYSNDEESSEGGADGSESRPSRWTARLARRFARFQDSWRHAETGFLGWVRRCWDWLHTFIHPQESMLGRLYRVRRIDLYHPAARSGDVQTIWRNYLLGRCFHHLLWCGLNSAVVPLAIVLALLPGPNVIGYWFAYRAFHHGLIVYGAWQARRGAIPTEFVPSPELDIPVQCDEEGRATHPMIHRTRARDRLDVYYEWAGGPRPSPRALGAGSSFERP